METNNYSQVEILQRRRFALSLRLNELHAEAVAASSAQNFNKGATVYIVSVLRGQPTSVVGRQVVLTSLGKRQGTAVHADDGKNSLVRVYRNHDILFATKAEVEAYAAKVGPLSAEESQVAAAHCSLCNRPNLYPQYVAKCDAEIAAWLAAADAPRYNVFFK